MNSSSNNSCLVSEFDQLQRIFQFFSTIVVPLAGIFASSLIAYLSYSNRFIDCKKEFKYLIGNSASVDLLSSIGQLIVQGYSVDDCNGSIHFMSDGPITLLLPSADIRKHCWYYYSLLYTSNFLLTYAFMSLPLLHRTLIFYRVINVDDKLITRRRSILLFLSAVFLNILLNIWRCWDDTAKFLYPNVPGYCFTISDKKGVHFIVGTGLVVIITVASYLSLFVCVALLLAYFCRAKHNALLAGASSQFPRRQVYLTIGLVLQGSTPVVCNAVKSLRIITANLFGIGLSMSFWNDIGSASFQFNAILNALITLVFMKAYRDALIKAIGRKVQGSSMDNKTLSQQQQKNRVWTSARLVAL